MNQFFPKVTTSDAGERGIDPLPFRKGGRGAFFITVSLVISRFIKIELKQILLQLFAHPETSECFSIIFVSIEEKQAQLVAIFMFFIRFHCPQLFTALLPYRFYSVPGYH